MPRRRSDELMAEADRLVAQAKEQRARERKLERQADDHRCRLLGRALTRTMRTDVNLRARMKLTMQGYCKVDRDREVFGLDLGDTWFETLTAPRAAHATPELAESDHRRPRATATTDEPSPPRLSHESGGAQHSPTIASEATPYVLRPNAMRQEDP